MITRIVVQTIAVYKQKTQEIKDKYVINNIGFAEDNETYIFSLDKDTTGIIPGDMVENLSAQPEVLIENCQFGSFRGTMRLQSRSKTVVRNCIFHNSDISLLFTGDTTYWFESGPVNDFTIDGCTFNCLGVRFLFEDGVQHTENAKYYHSNITVMNSRFIGGTVAKLKYIQGFRKEGETPAPIHANLNVVVRESTSSINQNK